MVSVWWDNEKAKSNEDNKAGQLLRHWHTQSSPGSLLDSLLCSKQAWPEEINDNFFSAPNQNQYGKIEKQ